MVVRWRDRWVICGCVATRLLPAFVLGAPLHECDQIFRRTLICNSSPRVIDSLCLQYFTATVKSLSTPILMIHAQRRALLSHVCIMYDFFTQSEYIYI